MKQQDVAQQRMTIKTLLQAYRSGELNVREFLTAKLAQAKQDNDNVWISTLSQQQLDELITQLEQKENKDLPLYGIPFAIKDNIDLEFLPTTAGCEAYCYQPHISATVVELLMQAGAIPLGKTNLDQFATGLVGVRSPWGAVKNSLDPEYISGGSSSGSAVAVAKGQVSFALGTDTAGSGRVPAAFNNILGMKATKGLVSCAGVVPACKSLDCVTFFANCVPELDLLLDIAAQPDSKDCYSRTNIASNSTQAYEKRTDLTGVTIGMPQEAQLNFFGDKDAKALFSHNLETLKQLGAQLVRVDFSPFIEAAKLLYEGPWVAERYAAIEEFFSKDPKKCLPVIETIISDAETYSAIDTFKAQYKLQAFKAQCDAILSQVDCIVTPTTGTTYSIEEVKADPIQLNANLGYYTNFMNLLDYSAIALPGGFLPSGLSLGITLFAPAFSDRLLLGIGTAFQKYNAFPLGATGQPLAMQATMEVMVCGAHLSGEPLNVQLTERNAHLVKACKTAPAYRMYALAGGAPYRPGLARIASGCNEQGCAIDVEVWRIPVQEVGSFLQGIAQPLGLGKVELEDGSWVTGFICEEYGLDDAVDISQYGSWKAYIREVI